MKLNRKQRKYLKLSVPFIILAAIVINRKDCDDTCLQDRLSNHQIRRSFFWQEVWSKPLEERIELAPAALIRFINLDNQIQGYPTEASASEWDPATKSAIEKIFHAYPVGLRSILTKHLAGLYPVKKLGGTGYTDVILKGDTTRGFFMVLDVDNLRLDGNTWLSRKISSPFLKESGWQARGILAAESENNDLRTLEFLLLHEVGHIVGSIYGLHPQWWLPAEKKSHPLGEYFDLSWNYEDEGWANTEGFEYSNDLKFFYGGNIAAERMVEVYSALQQTSFPTLYGSTNPYDDFAEGFATYMYAKLYSRPYNVILEHNGLLVQSFKPCWGTSKCADKEKILLRLWNEFQETQKD